MIEYYEDENGELHACRDSFPKEAWAFWMMPADWQVGGHDIQDCPVWHKLRKQLNLSIAEAKRLGLRVYRRIVHCPRPDPTREDGWILLRHRMPQDAVKLHDNGGQKEPVLLSLHGMSASQTKAAKRQYGADTRERKRKRATKNTGQKYTPPRSTERMRSS